MLLRFHRYKGDEGQTELTARRRPVEQSCGDVVGAYPRPIALALTASCEVLIGPRVFLHLLVFSPSRSPRTEAARHAPQGRFQFRACDVVQQIAVHS